MSLRIFISRDQNQVKNIAEFCSKNRLTLFAKSLIDFTPVKFNIPTQWDVVFFPSPRAAKFFLENCNPTELSGKKIACAGKDTAKSISNYSDLIDFIPIKAGNSESVQKEFQHWLGKRMVIYAGSNLAKKSVLQDLPESQWKFIHIYNTVFNQVEVPTSDIYIFSSPSNVQSFLTNNILPKEAKIIAWGETTAEELWKNNVTVYQTLETSGEEELIALLTKLD